VWEDEVLYSSLLAYLDPGSGSIILQVLVGGVAAVTVTARLWWRGIKSKLGFGRPSADQQDS
jgi:hypothetical protein